MSVHDEATRSTPGGAAVDDEAGGVVPDGVVARAKAAIATRATGSLVVMVSDSALNALAPTTVRTLRFVDPSVSVKVSVTEAGVWRTICGRVVPERLRVQLEREGSAGTAADEVAPGSFGFAPTPRGLVRLRLYEPDGSASARTEWFVV